MTTLPATKSDTKRAYDWNAAARVLTVTGSRKGSAAAYLVDELDAEGGRGFQLTKLAGGSDAEAGGYACFFGAGGASCECKGALRWGRCKHLDSLQDLISNDTI